MHFAPSDSYSPLRLVPAFVVKSAGLESIRRMWASPNGRLVPNGLVQDAV